MQCCGSLYSKCQFLQKRSDVVKTDQTAQAGHIRGGTRVQYVSVCVHAVHLLVLGFSFFFFFLTDAHEHEA